MAVLRAGVQVSSASVEITEAAARAAARHGVPRHEVLTRLLLHLPREATADGFCDLETVCAEADRRAARLEARTRDWRDWAIASDRKLAATDLELVRIDSERARIVLERFHYLESFRGDGAHHGGVTAGGRLAAILSVTPLDLETVAAGLPRGLTRDQAAVLARVFAFDWTPPNSLSFLIGRLVRGLRAAEPAPRLLVTYLNPNLGFTGASYRAANWRLWAREHGTRYAYLDGDYVTDRALAARFGSADPQALRSLLGKRIRFSEMELRPLELYAYPIDAELRGALEVRAPAELAHPTP